MLEELNNFFSKIGEKLASEFGTNDKELFKILFQPSDTINFLKSLRINEVIVAIYSLNFHKSFLAMLISHRFFFVPLAVF